MNTQEDILQTAGESFEYANIYVEKRLELIKLEGAERIAKTTSSIITMAVLGFMATMVLIMLSIAAGFAIGQFINSYAIAFLIITLLYAIVGLLVYRFKRQLVTNPVLTAVLESLFD